MSNSTGRSGHTGNSISVPPTSTTKTAKMVPIEDASEPRCTRAVTSTATASSSRIVVR